MFQSVKRGSMLRLSTSMMRSQKASSSIFVETCQRLLLRSNSSTTLTTTNAIADHCDLNIVKSPYPSIPSGPYEHVAEFVMQDWKGSSLEDKVAIVDGTTGLSRTFADYGATATNLAATLKYEMNIEETSTVALFCPNHVDYAPILLAVSLCGARITPINPMCTKTELGMVLERSRSEVLLVHHSKLDLALESLVGNEICKHVIVIPDHGGESNNPEGTVELSDLIQHSSPIEKTVAEMHKYTNSHPLLLPYSSGTTGLPKAVCLTHENLVVNLLQLDEAESFSFPRDHKMITPLPFFHIYALTCAMLHCAWKGNTVITTSGPFSLEKFCQLVEEHKPQRSHLVPPIILGLAKHPMVDNYDLSSITSITSAAAPLGAETEVAAQERLGCIVKQAWGMSELSPVGTINTDFNFKTGSVGPLVPDTFGKVVDEKGASLPPNEPGELLIKGPQVMMGYLDEPDKTAECLSSGGWLRTGDVAYYDEEGYFFITDRFKELIKVKGFQVAPAELEALLLTNENVNDAAVIQIPDERAGELPRAYVVLKDGVDDSEQTREAIYDFVKERAAAYKRLDGGIVFTRVIPKSASGKILRRILRDELKKEMEQA